MPDVLDTPPEVAEGSTADLGYQPYCQQLAGAKPSVRELRRLGRAWPLEEVCLHKARDDCWIAVDEKVYDITEHVRNHPGWTDAHSITTVLSILAHAGTDCSEEFREIHRPYPVAWKQLKAYYIGDLARQRLQPVPA